MMPKDRYDPKEAWLEVFREAGNDLKIGETIWMPVGFHIVRYVKAKVVAGPDDRDMYTVSSEHDVYTWRIRWDNGFKRWSNYEPYFSHSGLAVKIVKMLFPDLPQHSDFVVVHEEDNRSHIDFDKYHEAVKAFKQAHPNIDEQLETIAGMIHKHAWGEAKRD